MRIREARPEDFDAIAALTPIVRTDVSRARLVRTAIERDVVLVAEVADAVVAYGVLRHEFFEQGFLELLYVAPGHRRRGIGRALVVELDGRCRTEKLFTSTNESNLPMQALLAGLGWVPSGRIENLDPGDPELVYARPPVREGHGPGPSASSGQAGH